MMYSLILVFGLFSTTLSSNTFQTLVPHENKLYTYTIRADVSTGTATPKDEGSRWTLEGQLLVQAYDDFGRLRLQLENLQTLVNGKHGSSSHQSTEAAEYLKKPWEVGICFSAIHINNEPEWVTNMKRAISFNFLLASRPSTASTTSGKEPCLYGNCVVIYFHIGNKTRKYNSLVDFKRNDISTYEQDCLPNKSSDWYRATYSEDPSYIMTAERVFELDEKRGLMSLELINEFQYKTRHHILSVSTELSLNYESERPMNNFQKLNLSEAPMQYVRPSHSNPSQGIFSPSQSHLKNKTYGMLLKIAKKGIDTDNIVRNASLIHSLDFIELLTTMSQLNYTSLTKLFEDVLGTSYELETARNIFLEILPYVRNDACAKLIRYLVIEQKSKIEDTMLVSLLRKLPYNVVDYSRELLQDLEVFTKLGPEVPREIRHAGILSFATLVYKTMEVSFDQQYFDDVYDKYLKMYNYCPQYLDRLIWLQGLTNIGKSVVNYLDEIHTDNNKNRHERLWAGLASLSIWKGTMSLENILPILMNNTEHIQLRVLALHSFLSSPLGSKDFINVHNYIQSCDNGQLKKFWYSTLKSLENNRFYNRYKTASYYIPFVANQVSNPDPKHWATNNFIISQEPYVTNQEPPLDLQGPTFQLLTVGGRWSGPAEMIIMEFSTGGEQPFFGAIYVIAEGVTYNAFQRFQNSTELSVDKLLHKLKEMKVQVMEPEKVHIDIVVKIQDKTVYATHIDQTRFDSWNIEDFKQSIEDFVRFGSHINQQIVYYPVQAVKYFPTEIGTPIRFHSTIVSFTSLRGNLTAPSSDYLTWRNDLHIRYQGTSVTSLSTDGPLQPSEHTVRTQQSMVIHLPIKLDVSYSPEARSFELKWTNPAQNGGVAVHSRTQISVDSKKGNNVHTVTKTQGLENDVAGIYFDCEHPLTESEISQLLTSRSYNLLSFLQPSKLILNTIRFLTTPTSGSCGLILPPRQLQTGNKLKLEVKLDDIGWESNKEHVKITDRRNMKLQLSYLLSYYREDEDANTVDSYISIKGYTKIESDGKNGTVQMVLNSLQPHAVDTSWRNWTICFQEQHRLSDASVDIDFTMNPAEYEGQINVNFSSANNFTCFQTKPTSTVMINFVSKPIKALDDLQRNWKFKIMGKNLPKLDLGSSDVIGKSDFASLLRSIGGQTPDNKNIYVEMREQNNVAHVKVNGSKALELRSDVLDWLPDSWTTLQTMRRLGMYRECRIQGSSIHTFSAETRQLPVGYHELLVAGDCTRTPRYAVTLVSESQGVSGIAVQLGNWSRLAFEPGLIRSQLTDIQVYHSVNETIILIAQPYLWATCGACMGQNYQFT